MADTSHSPDPRPAGARVTMAMHTDIMRARDIARPYVKDYGQLENYANSWRRLGFSEADIANSSDRLVDALVQPRPSPQSG